MKILSVIIAHDGRADTLLEVIKAAKEIKEIDSLEIFCFDTEHKVVEVAKECGLICNIRARPEIDKSKLTCSYVNHGTGMWEGELMHLSYLRNEVLDHTVKREAAYLFWIDADVICPPDTLERLLALDVDMAMGWYFHKRLPFPSVGYKGQRQETMDNDFKEKKIVEGNSGGNGGVLITEKVFKNIRYDLYNGTKAEDTVYYKKAKAFGCTMKLDLGLHYPHIGGDFKPKALEFALKKAKIWNVEIPYVK